MGQPCDGTLCKLCTRCSNCKYQKLGTYQKHVHVFTDDSPEAVEPAVTHKSQAVKTAVCDSPQAAKKPRAKRAPKGATV